MTELRFHQGRLLDHVHLRVTDLDASKAFYAAALDAVGLRITMEGPGFFSAESSVPDWVRKSARA